MKTVQTAKCELHIPEPVDVQLVKVGVKAPDPFGGMSTVTKVFAKGISITGKEYVCYYVKFGDMAAISMSLMAGRLIRTAKTCRHHTSDELNWYEKKHA